MGRAVRCGLRLLCFVFFVSFALIACSREAKSVKIGFLGALTGKSAETGLMVRNAAALYLEEANRQGGVDGGRIELVAIDDKNDAKEGLLALAEFTKNEVAAVIGPVSNSVAAALVPRLDETGILFISPTVRLVRISSKDDCFIRLRPSLRRTARFLGSIAVSFNLKHLTAVIDYGNRLYGRDWVDDFTEVYASGGGFMDIPVTYISNYEVSFSSLASMVLSRSPDGVLLVTGPSDTAMICQHLKKLCYKGRILASDWSVSGDLVAPGGTAVDGIFFVEASIFGGPGNDTSIRFAAEFKERYGKKPTTSAYYGYDAAMVVVEGLRKAGPRASAQKLKSTIFEIKNFYGTRGGFSIPDAGGGGERLHLFTIHEGRFWEIR